MGEDGDEVKVLQYSFVIIVHTRAICLIPFSKIPTFQAFTNISIKIYSSKPYPMHTIEIKINYLKQGVSLGQRRVHKTPGIPVPAFR